MKKSEKPFFVENLTEELKGASSIVLVDYTGLSVKLQQELKKKIKAVNAKMIICKNTLFKLAGEKAKLEKEALADTVLAGPTALIISQKDPIAPLQVLASFAKENLLPQFKVGIIEGKFQNKEALTTLSTLPSKDILFAQVTGAISSPLYGITGILQANLQKLISILSAKAKQE